MNRKTILVAAAATATALAAPVAADAAKYSGKAGGSKITFSQKGKKISNVKTLIFVSCFPTPGSGTDGGAEIFNPPGKFTLGKETRRHASRHSAVRGGKKGFNFTVTPTRKSARKITGKLRLSYSDSVYDPFTAEITFWNCSGSTKFTATRR
jgi:opacity protein-like surface antigen